MPTIPITEHSHLSPHSYELPSTQVEIAGTKALADLAQKNKNNRVRIAEREESIPAIMQQLVKAELQLTLTRELESVAKQRGEKPLMTCLEKHFDAKWLHFMAKLAQDVSHSEGKGGGEVTCMGCPARQNGCTCRQFEPNVPSLAASNGEEGGNRIFVTGRNSSLHECVNSRRSVI